MRIAYFTSEFPRATDTFIQREIFELKNLGTDVRPFAIRKPGKDNIVSDSIQKLFNETTYLLPANTLKLLMLNFILLISKPHLFLSTLKLAISTAKPGIKGHLFQLFYFQEAILLADALKKQKIEHIHNHLGDNSGTVTMLASRISKIPYSITIHGPHIFFDPLHWALKEKLKFAKFIACISHFCKSQMMLYTDASDRHKLKIIHCGIDLKQYNFLESKDKKLPKHALQLLYVGRLSAEKGVPILIDALIQLIEEGYTFHLTLLGDGPDRQHLEKLVYDKSLEAFIKFGGYASQELVRTKIYDSDVFILPSFAEGVPVSLMESMACGTPVISTYVGGITELIENDKTGQLVFASDVISLKTAIIKYIDNPDLVNQIKWNARKKIEADFNLIFEVAKLHALFSEK